MAAPLHTSLHSRKRLCLLHVIANHRLATAETLQSFACHCEERGGCTATWQSVLLAVGQNEKQHLGQIRNRLRIRPKCDFFSPFSAGKRIATSLRSSQ